MEFQDGCLDIAARAWGSNGDFPMIVGFKYGLFVQVQIPDIVDNDEKFLEFVHCVSGDGCWDALAVVSEVWFDMVTFGKPLQLSAKNPDAQDGLAVALITMNRSYVSLAHVKNGELGKFSPWRIMAGGRYFDVKLAKKMKKAV